MTPFYWESHHGNFGDDLNLWLWDFLLPGFRDIRPDVLLVGVGTVLNRALLPETGRKLVIGSGYGYGDLPDMPAEWWDVRCVRGPATAKALGREPELGIIDPAVMVAEMPEFQNLGKVHEAIFIPHWESTIGGIWPEVSKATGVTYIDPCGEAKSVITAIAQSKLVIAESMHAAIIADAFRVPWVAVSTSSAINRFKWSDWTETVGATYEPLHVPISSRAEAIFKGARFWGVDYKREAPAPGEATGSSPAEDGKAAEDERRRASLPRKLVKLAMAAPSILALRKAKTARTQLSADAVLAARKDRFRAVLGEIRQAYF